MQRQPEAALAAAQAIENPDDMMRLQGIALAEHDLGHRLESDQALEKLTSRWGHGAQYQIAQVHAWRGDADRAFEWLERAFRERDPAISFMRVDPALRGLRDDPRYAVLLRKMNFPVD
jgi:tetratricopeptide (TPR) repeat protein